MAANPQNPPPPVDAAPAGMPSVQPPAAAKPREYDFRERLSTMVVLGSFLILGLLIAMIVVFSGRQDPSVAMLAEKTFTLMLPVLTGWVSIVLTFYFQSRALDQTTETLRKQVESQQGGSSQLNDPPVGDKMLPFAQIRGMEDLAATTPENVELSSLQTRMQKEGQRKIFHHGTVFRHMLHLSTLDAFLVKYAAAQAKLKPAEPRLATLKDLLDDPDFNKQVTNSVVFASLTTPLSRARADLKTVAGAKDIIVTVGGKPDGIILGWLSDVDLLAAVS